MNHSFPDAATLSMMKHMYKSNASSLYYRSHAVLHHVLIAPPHPLTEMFTPIHTSRTIPKSPSQSGLHGDQTLWPGWARLERRTRDENVGLVVVVVVGQRISGLKETPPTTPSTTTHRPDPPLPPRSQPLSLFAGSVAAMTFRVRWRQRRGMDGRPKAGLGRPGRRQAGRRRMLSESSDAGPRRGWPAV